MVDGLAEAMHHIEWLRKQLEQERSMMRMLQNTPMVTVYDGEPIEDIVKERDALRTKLAAIEEREKDK